MSLTARERILTAADELFYGDGIATTGVDAVVDRAGVALGSVYNNFGGKDGLVEAYLRRRDHLWRALWERVAADAATPRERVLSVFDALLEWCRDQAADQGCAQVAGLLQLPAGHPAVAVARTHKEHLMRRLTELAAGLTGVREVAEDVAILYEGVLVRMLLGSPPEEAIPRARKMAETVIAARSGTSAP
ncbi:TetR family transcriptional regulator [Lentzea atacamensis]|uniref:TetR family transcriptional regulator n=1 Tax=Lentzea atacamensis TaxID=531938 RepID=A0ABX9ELY4_9PSEU|nr:TetR/AcrR family transcriptional regulator [Lentzea atacamensis]RAS70976.1 TetR family transcriptional regulator [Lentzea atacamensis]